MKDYVKPTSEFLEIKPEEWLTTDSSNGGAQGKCIGNDWLAPGAGKPTELGCVHA